MATEEQIQRMLMLMEQQMAQLNTLQTENTQLRNTAATDDAPLHRPPRPKTKSPDRPVINSNTDEQEWELFKDSWNRYKTMTAITEVSMLRLELRSACSPDVNRLLFEYIGADALNTATEVELLEYVKSVAVKGTHKEVHRMKFFRLSQMDGETITQFVARLRSHAILCQFKIACENHEQPTFVNFAEEMITQQLVSGLRNQQHQSRILSEAASLPTLRDKIERLQCLESTEQSTDLMRANPQTTSSTNAPAKSSYRRNQRNQYNKGPQQGGKSVYPCKGCGRTSHDGKTIARKDCPAFNKICGSCGIKGHFRAVCMKNQSSQSHANAVGEANQTTQEEDLADQHCDSTSFAFATTEDFRLAPPKNNRP